MCPPISFLSVLRFSIRRALPVGLLLALLLGGVPGAAAGAAPAAPCSACHAGVEHAHPVGPTCTDCHGAPGRHPAPPAPGEPALISFTEALPGARRAACEDCHGDATHGVGDAHERAGLACDACHAAHAPPEPVLRAGFERLDPASATCARCHGAVLDRFAMNERHRLAEGAVSCTSCHDAHAVGGTFVADAAGTEACADCHREVTGPFAYEHDAVRIEGCVACHAPHGGVNRYLLHHQREAELCYSCHAVVPQFHVGFAPGAPLRFGLDTPCTECHVAIHGSHFDPALLR